jgi:hypothetical protein
MRTLEREEIIVLKYSSEKTVDPPDQLFEKSVPLVRDDLIFDLIINEPEITDDQRYSQKNV